MPDTMKAIVFGGEGAFFTAERPVPAAQPGESLLRVRLAAVCSTDREVLRGYRPDFRGVMGHEFVATVLQSSDDALVGRRVVGELNENCGECLYCRTQRAHHCVARRVPGLDGRDGCFAEIMAYPTRLLHPVPDEVPDEEAIYCEPLAAALQIAERCHLPPSQEVAVLGDGRLALLCAQVVAANGTPVAVFGRHEEKLALFSPFARTGLSPSGSYEAVIEATGRPAGFAAALALVRSGGLLLLKSTTAENAAVNMSEVVVREITVSGSRCGPFVPALNLLRRRLVRLPAVRLYAPEDWQAAFSDRGFKSGFDFR